jgi:dihydroceramidase
MEETWNTITNLTFIILSIQGFRTVYVGAPFKLRLLPFLFTIVGIGSMAFHGTLLRTAQLLDELPMLFLISQSCFIILTIQPKTSELKKYILAILGIAINLSVTLIMIYYPGSIFNYPMAIFRKTRIFFYNFWADCSDCLFFVFVSLQEL